MSILSFGNRIFLDIPGQTLYKVFTWPFRGKKKKVAIGKKKREKVSLEKDHINLAVKHQKLGEKYAKLAGDFSETAKRMGLVEVERDGHKEGERQAKEMNTAFQNTVDEKDTELTKAAVDLKQANVNLGKANVNLGKANVDNLKLSSDLKQASLDNQKLSTDLEAAETALEGMKKSA
jgi:hypothetical protein